MSRDPVLIKLNGIDISFWNQICMNGNLHNNNLELNLYINGLLLQFYVLKDYHSMKNDTADIKIGFNTLIS